MRTSLLVALASILTVSAVGCMDANDGSTLGSRRARRTTAPPEVGAADDHDDSDSEDENSTDVGNPNADTKPDAPSTPGTAAPEFALTLAQNTPTVDLGESVDLDVTIEPKNGFTGNVDLTVTGLPAGATAAATTATVGAAGTTAKIKITAAVDAVATAPNTSSALVITGKSGNVSATANANFKIAPKLKLTIPVNVDALRAASVQYRDEWGSAFGASPKALRTQQGNGIVVTVFNADSKAHIVHGANGFAHGNTGAPIQPNAFEMANGAPRTRTLNVGTNANGYPHDGAQGVGASFRIRVEEAP